MYDNFPELYAIIKATEKLEKAHVHPTDCQQLTAHFKTLASSLKSSVPNIARFADNYKMDCPAAINRLDVYGIPATVKPRYVPAASSYTSAAIVAECVQNLITAMDSLKLNIMVVDHDHPLLSDLYGSLNKLSILPQILRAR